jgi:hypothetical protein
MTNATRAAIVPILTQPSFSTVTNSFPVYNFDHQLTSLVMHATSHASMLDAQLFRIQPFQLLSMR